VLPSSGATYSCAAANCSSCGWRHDAAGRIYWRVSASTSRQTVQIAHVVITSTKSFAEVRSTLENQVPWLDDETRGLLRDGVTDRLRQRLKAAPTLSIFEARDHGMLLGLYGQVRSAVQYEIGNPLTASSMTRYVLGAGLYAPLRVIIYEGDDGGTRIEYDLPSSLFGQFGDERVTEVGHALDVALGRALSAAAG